MQNRRSASSPLIEVVNVQKSFKKGERQELLVLEDVNFRMNEGEIVAILGKSGSGKSTLLRIIAGLVAPTSGTFFIAGNRCMVRCVVFPWYFKILLYCPG